MSLSLVSYPVSSPGQNVFPGNSEILIGFKREDIAVIDTEIGADSTIIINIGSDISSELNVGETIYLNSGDLYDLTAEVLDIGVDFVRVNSQWLGAATAGGYLNYRQNWYAELQIINPDNELIQILPFTLRDDGNIEGDVEINLAVINDLNDILAPDFDSGVYEMQNRVKFDIKYREVYREATGVYTRISDPIIIIPAKRQGTIELFNNQFSEPEYYKSYPNGAIFLHSDSDPLASDNVVFYFDEKDINKNTIRANQLLGSLVSDQVYGRLFIPLVNLNLLDDTEFIELRREAEAIPEFSPTDFTSDFNIGT